MTTRATLERQVGQLILAGFDGTTADDALCERIAAGLIGAVILFRRNVGSPGQVARLVGALQEAVPAGDPPLLVAVDQEGGRVRRLREPWPDWPPAAVLGQTGDAGLIEAVGHAMGTELAACGIHTGFAPVLDVHTNPDNPVIGDRSFGPTAEVVVGAAGAYAHGLERAGIAACGKHFPGHGDTESDSHLELPVVRHPAERLDSVELRPFAALAEALPLVMTAHVMYPAWDPEHPATLSQRILTGILRERLAFTGVLVSDDLEMHAVLPPPGEESPGAGVGDVACRAVRAGVDLLPICKRADRQEAARAALVAAASDDPLLASRIAEAAARIAALKARYVDGGRPDPERAERLARDPAHHALAARIPR